MRRFRLTDPAAAEFEGILDFCKAVSPKYAKTLNRELRQRFRLVARYPRLGTPVSHFAPGMRRTSVRDITIYFRDEGGVTVIHHVVQGARDIDAAFFDGAST